MNIPIDFDAGSTCPFFFKNSIKLSENLSFSFVCNQSQTTAVVQLFSWLKMVLRWVYYRWLYLPCQQSQPRNLIEVKTLIKK